MDENKPHPLARMVTIRNPFFWAFFSICVILYIYNKSIEPTTGDIVRYSRHDSYLCLTVFTGLFLTLIAQVIKKPKLKRLFFVFCYVFEAAGLVWLGAIIFIR